MVALIGQCLTNVTKTLTIRTEPPHEGECFLLGGVRNDAVSLDSIAEWEVAHCDLSLAATACLRVTFAHGLVVDAYRTRRGIEA